MNKYCFLRLGVVIGLLSLTSCLDNDVEDQGALDDASISNYLNAQGIDAQRTESGLYYTVLNQGTGATPANTDIVEIIYDLELLDSGVEVEIDSSYVYKAETGALMRGLVEGVTLMNQGATYRFFIPSTLAFGGSSGNLNNVFIPSNSSFIMDVTLVDIRDEAAQQTFEREVLRDYLQTIDSLLLVNETATGVIRAVLSEGDTTVSPNYGSLISVDYEGSFLNGEVFDANADISFTLDTIGLIKGWYDGISQMEVGEESLILIPSDRAYGATGNRSIGPYESLVFRIRLRGVLQ